MKEDAISEDDTEPLDPLIGLKLTDALTILGKAKIQYRIKKIDGRLIQQGNNSTVQNRVYLEIDDGVITAYNFS